MLLNDLFRMEIITAQYLPRQHGFKVVLIVQRMQKSKIIVPFTNLAIKT